MKQHTSEPIRAEITAADDDVSTKACKSESGRKANAARATSDKHNLLLELGLVVCRTCRDALNIVNILVVSKASHGAKELLASHACSQKSRKNQERENHPAHQSFTQKKFPWEEHTQKCFSLFLVGFLFVFKTKNNLKMFALVQTNYCKQGRRKYITCIV